jgi:hypothetical protein
MLAVPLRAEVVERIQAVVDGRPLMRSEVRLVEQLRGLDPAAALEALIDEQLMLREASRLAESAVSAEDEQRGHQDLVARVPGASAFPEADLRHLVRRQTAIIKYVEFRFRAQVQVGDAAVREEYDREYGARADAPPPETVADEIRRRLGDRAIDAKIEAGLSCGWARRSATTLIPSRPRVGAIRGRSGKAREPRPRLTWRHRCARHDRHRRCGGPSGRRGTAPTSNEKPSSRR